MNKILTSCLLLLFTLLFTSCLFDEEEEWNASNVCPEAGTNRYGMPNRGTFTDERDGREYKYTTIGDQVWMAENLKYDAPYSMCPNDDKYVDQYCNLIESNCDSKECCLKSMCELYGRYYSIIDSGKYFGLIDRSFADTLCPKGWHIPTKEEWLSFFDNMKGPDDAAAALFRMKSSDTTLFFSSEYDSSGSNVCGMNVFLSGMVEPLYSGAGTIASTTLRLDVSEFLSSTQASTISVWAIIFYDTMKSNISSNSYRNTVRCVKD